MDTAVRLVRERAGPDEAGSFVHLDRALVEGRNPQPEAPRLEQLSREVQACGDERGPGAAARRRPRLRPGSWVRWSGARGPSSRHRPYPRDAARGRLEREIRPAD